MSCNPSRAVEEQEQEQMRSSEHRSRRAFAVRLLSTLLLQFVRTCQPLMQRTGHPFPLRSRPPFKRQSSSRVVRSSSSYLEAGPVGMPPLLAVRVEGNPATHPMSPQPATTQLPHNPQYLAQPQPLDPTRPQRDPSSSSTSPLPFNYDKTL